MQKTITRCDDCDTVLTAHSQYQSWGLVLYACDYRVKQLVPKITDDPWSEVIEQPRPIERDHHFCGLGCLESWIGKQQEDAGGV